MAKKYMLYLKLITLVTHIKAKKLNYTSLSLGSNTHNARCLQERWEFGLVKFFIVKFIFSTCSSHFRDFSRHFQDILRLFLRIFRHEAEEENTRKSMILNNEQSQQLCHKCYFHCHKESNSRKWAGTFL